VLALILAVVVFEGLEDLNHTLLDHWNLTLLSSSNQLISTFRYFEVFACNSG
jgi:hypothetical protein